RGRRLYNCVVVINREGQITHCYAKCQLTPRDTRWFAPGNAIALFDVEGVQATAIICHERRYPELVRLAVMAGARIVFHPNAGLDPLPVSRKKRGGRDGIPARAFENAVYYVFANTVGPQPEGKWSAGDSKIVAPDERVLALADNETESVLAATLDLAKASRVYAERGLRRPEFLRSSWKAMIEAVRRQAGKAALSFSLPNKKR
ncbi:MAG TPA: carbon-nitrogen hydrolase family protein, partial [Planctomycetaceae bacterium]|nr:carbon-nitrogen hydrolase family protein [Planctomycetaceae bacterium]